MALYRNISGIGAVVDNDVYQMKCDESGCTDITTGQVIDYYRPQQGSGVFPPVTQYPYDPISNNQPGPPVMTVVNTAPVLPIGPATQDGNTAKKKSDATDKLILIGMGIALYMGMTREKNNIETIVYAGGLAALVFKWTMEEKGQTLPVTE